MLLKAFRLLEAFREKTGGLTYGELIERYPDISRVSVYRILCTLEALGFLWKEDKTGRYELGAKFIELGKIAENRLDIVRISRPYLEDLRHTYGENVNLVQLRGPELVYLERLEGTHPIRVMELHDRRQCIHSSASGKCILAFLPGEERESILSQLHLEPLTPKTIQDPRALEKELKQIHSQGYGVDEEENILGVRCVGAPVLNQEGYPLAAVSITGPASRLSKSLVGKIGSHLIEVTREISSHYPGMSGSGK